MIRRLLRYLLLLMLSAGPLQAQTVLLCSMMEVPRQETCCCGHDTEVAREAKPSVDCERPQCPVAARAEAAVCCDSTVEVSYEPEARQPAAKPSEGRSDPELPTSLLVAYELSAPPWNPMRVPVPRPRPVANSDGSSLYLRTERLRI